MPGGWSFDVHRSPPAQLTYGVWFLLLFPQKRSSPKESTSFCAQSAFLWHTLSLVLTCEPLYPAQPDDKRRSIRPAGCTAPSMKNHNRTFQPWTWGSGGVCVVLPSGPQLASQSLCSGLSALALLRGGSSVLGSTPLVHPFFFFLFFLPSQLHDYSVLSFVQLTANVPLFFLLSTVPLSALHQSNLHRLRSFVRAWHVFIS